MSICDKLTIALKVIMKKKEAVDKMQNPKILQFLQNRFLFS